MDALYLPPPSLVYFLLSVVFLLFFFGSEDLFFFFLLKPKVRRIKFQVGIPSVFFFFIIITIIIIAREEISEREQVLALMEQRDNAAWSSSEGELCVEHMSDIMGLIHRRKSRTPRRCRSGGRGERWVTTAASWERGREGGERGGGCHAPTTTAITTGEGGCCPAGPGLIAADWPDERSHRKSSRASLEKKKKKKGVLFQDVGSKLFLFKGHVLCGF